jgi:hypothetical protein
MSLVTGALMLRVVRHNLRVLLRLAALLVLLGLGTVPVECAAVYGPHSVFLSAESVAALRASASGSEDQAVPSPHSHMASPSAADPMTMEMDAAADSAASSGPGLHQGAATGTRASVPATAGAMTDALISIALIEAPVGIAAGIPAPLPLPISQPISHQLPAPEPPPP